MNSIITITGDIGSGKSSVAKELSKNLKFNVISTGNMQREIAKSMNVTILELNKLSLQDDSIDKRIDSYIKTLEDKSNLIIDSRLAWHFLKDSFKIYLSVDSLIGAKRVYNDSRETENNTSIQETLKNNARRQEIEYSRFENKYKVNLESFGNYDLIVDTSYSSAPVISKEINKQYHSWIKNKYRNVMLVSPKRLIPTQSIRDCIGRDYDYVFESIQTQGFNKNYPIKVFYHNNCFYIWDGHKRTLASSKLNIDLIPADIIATTPNFQLIKGLSVSKVVEDISQTAIYDWEDAIGS